MSRRKDKKNNVASSLPFPNLRIDCYGRSTYIYLDGMEISSGVLEVDFHAGSIGNEKKPPVLKLKLHPHVTVMRRVGRERIETTRSTHKHAPSKKKR